MSDPRIVNLARILVHYSVSVKPDEKVLIGVPKLEPLATPLIQEVYREVIRAGGYPYTYIPPEGLNYILLTEGSEEQIRAVNPIFAMVAESFDAGIAILGESNTRHLSNVDPKKLSLWAKSFDEPLNTIDTRVKSGAYRWVVTQFPTQAAAQEAEMNLVEFEDFLYAATYADTDDPMSRWQALHDYQERLVQWLMGKNEVVVKGPNVDLSLSIEGRAFHNCDGRVNMPDGEIFTGPVENSVNGWVRFSYPAIYAGREVEDVELHFEVGKVVQASAKKGEDLLLEMLDTDAGARYMGEFAIGTNNKIERFIKSMLFDEKLGGTIHMALGHSALGTGENESAIHWDMLCDMRDGGQIFVDGELFYDSGEFRI